jgi:hypothetical protein
MPMLQPTLMNMRRIMGILDIYNKEMRNIILRRRNKLLKRRWSPNEPQI